MADSLGRLVVVGLGLIGGSFALSVRKKGLFREVIGIDSSAESISRGVELGVIDSGDTNIHSVIPSLGPEDVVFIAVPTLAVSAVLAELVPYLSNGMTITDAASVKGSVLEACQHVFGEVPPSFVAGHPIAGSENSGVTAAKEGLYGERRCILCPTPNTSPEHLERVMKIWQTINADVHVMDAATHDRVFAATSHLPHVIAFSLVDTLANGPLSAEVFENAAGGFKEFTRVASSNPRMWKDISLANKAAIIECLDRFAGNLQNLRAAIEAEQGEDLEAAYARAKGARDNFLCAD